MMKELLIKAKGGMGNRMLCTATGILYALAVGRRPIIDWSDGAYADPGVNAFPHFFSDPSCSVNIPNENGKRVVPSMWSGNLDKSMSWMIHTNDPGKHSSLFIHRKYSIDPARIYYPEDIAVYWSYTERVGRLLRGAARHAEGIKGESKRHVLRKTLLEHFVLKPSIQEDIERFRSTRWADQVIGVHVRFTDRKIRLDKYEKPLRHMLDRYPNATIFLATDNATILSHFNERYRRVLTTEKWYPPAADCMHQNNSCPDKLRNGMEALIDMSLLAQCSALIYPSYSTFSSISALLSQAAAENIIDVNRWDVNVRLKRFVREMVS